MGAADTVYAYDRRHSRISVFDGSGDLVAVISVGREFAGGGTIALDAWAFDSDHYVLHSVGPIDVVLGSGVAYELLVMTGVMKRQTVIRWLGWTQRLEESMVQAARDSMAARFEAVSQADPERVTALLDAIFAPELTPATLPVLGDVLIDRQDRMWVSSYSPRTEQWRQEDSWHVLDPSGRPIDRLSLPSRTRLGAVGDERVALITLDESDVPHIQVFSVAFGAGRQ